MTKSKIKQMQRAPRPGFAAIKIDKRVADVDGVRQDRVLPMGHPIKWRGKKFRVHLIQRETVTHSNIDESPEWKQLVRKTLNELLA